MRGSCMSIVEGRVEEKKIYYGNREYKFNLIVKLCIVYGSYS